MAATALVGSLAFGGHAVAADIDNGTVRNWGGMWIGFGAGYAGTSASGSSSGDVCLSSTRRSGLASASAGCRINGGRVDLETEASARAGESEDPIQDNSANSSGGGSTSLPDLTTESRSRAEAFIPDTFIGTSFASNDPQVPEGTIYSGTSTSAGDGSDGTGDSLASGGNSQIRFPFGPLTVGPGGGDIEAVAGGSMQASSETGIYGGASYASARAGGSSAEALAIGFGGLPSFDSGSESGGDFAPNINARFDVQTPGNWIIGAEIDLSIPRGAAVDASGQTDIDLLAEFEELSVERGFELETNALASARLRLGYAMDDFMIYGTGGLAYANVEATASVTGAYNGNTASASSSKTADAFGGVIGGGIAAFVADNAAILIEGLYYRFDETVEFEHAGQDASVEIEDAFSVMMKFSIRAY